MITINEFARKKQVNEKITMMTCYDYTTAKIIDRSEIDVILVGDTAAMVMHGYPDTTSATIEMMETHTAAVARGIQHKFIVADLPFMTYRKSLKTTIEAVQTLVQAGAHAIKLEGANGNLDTIKHIVESGVPVMGHIGLTPQHIHALGGFKVQGKSENAYEELSQQATLLEEAGCFAIVLECIPANLAAKITRQIQIPTIGIGAGPDTDGQVLVLQDMLGLQIEFKPKFLKKYLNGEELFTNGINTFSNEVLTKQFPSDEHCYTG